jgi:hypothetical protein
MKTKRILDSQTRSIKRDSIVIICPATKIGIKEYIR